MTKSKKMSKVSKKEGMVKENVVTMVAKQAVPEKEENMPVAKQAVPEKENMPEQNKTIENKVAAKSKPSMKAKIKGQRPKSKATQKADQSARLALGTGDINKDEVTRKKDQDSRTLYIRFGDKAKLPNTADQIKELHPDIKFVRTPRTAVKGKGAEPAIGYAFVEFGDQDECKEAHKKLSTTLYKGKEMVVDFVGANSKNRKQKAQASENKNSSRLNPTRLFICGLAPGVNKTHLKDMFPKASHADIPARSKKKGTSYGFVQFATPGDAKAAFDAAKDLSIADHKITVLYAKITEAKPEVLQKKAEKRKANKEKKEKKEAKKLKTDDSENVQENDEDSDEESNEVNTKETKTKVKTEIKKKVNEDCDEDNDEESDDEETEAADANEEGEEEDEDDDDDDEDDDDEEGVEAAKGPDTKEEDDDEDDDDDDDDDDDEDDDDDDDE